jgi:hypothetical protein
MQAIKVRDALITADATAVNFLLEVVRTLFKPAQLIKQCSPISELLSSSK